MVYGILQVVSLRGSRCSSQSDLVNDQPLQALVGRFGEPGFRTCFKAQQPYSASSRPRPRRDATVGVGAESLVHQLAPSVPPTELGIIQPHAVQNDGEFSGHGNHGTAVTASFGQLHTPDFQ